MPGVGNRRTDNQLHEHLHLLAKYENMCIERLDRCDTTVIDTRLMA